MHVNLYIYIHTYIHTYIDWEEGTAIEAGMRLLRASRDKNGGLLLGMYIRMYVYTYVCIYVCMCEIRMVVCC
jgi:hypothetical protein